jgi:acyl dehydratase
LRGNWLSSETHRRELTGLMMMEVEDAAALVARVGEHIGTSEWMRVDQALLDRFGDATGDKNWYHVDVERAAVEMPDGKTIAHGLLMLALVPSLAAPMLEIRNRKRSFNYGSNKVRYITPVQVGARVRLSVSLKQVDVRADGHLVTRLCTMEIEDQPKPAMVAEVLTLIPN